MGISPDAVLGHGMGEIAAAYVAGALSLDDATDIMGRRAGLEMTAAARAAGPSADTRPEPAATEFISAATGEPVDGVRLARGYWTESPRDPARFTDAVQGLTERGYGYSWRSAPTRACFPPLRPPCSRWAAPVPPLLPSGVMPTSSGSCGTGWPRSTALAARLTGIGFIPGTRSFACQAIHGSVAAAG